MFGTQEIKLTGKQSKTYHIGERCCYGTVKVTVHQNQVLKVAFCNYKTSDIQESKVFDKNERNDMMFYLEDNMDHYNADKIMKDFFDE